MLLRKNFILITIFVLYCMLSFTAFAEGGANNFASNPAVSNYTVDGVNRQLITKNYKELADIFKDTTGIVVVNIWASWCPPCKAETPGLVRVYNKLSKQYDNKTFSFIGVNVDDTHSDAIKFISSNKIPYQNYFTTQEEAANFGIQGFPTTIFFVNGKAMTYHTGYIDEVTIEKYIENLIKNNK